MKVLIRFSNHDQKSQVITQFISLKDCIANDNELIIPELIKIDYSNDYIDCFCRSLDVAERILSAIITIQTDNDNNEGVISFPKSLKQVLVESTVLDFNKILELTSSGNVQYVNTDKKSLKATVPLSQWLSANLNIEQQKAYINFKFNDYEINVSDGSALQFCTRVKEHPLISVGSLGNYFNFGSEIKLKPIIDYFCFWKVLKSENGYKKYSNFINECNNNINVIYDDGKKYRCEFDGGKIDFHLLSVGDKYPKKVVLQIEELKDISIIKTLQKVLNFKSIDLMCRVSNLRLSTTTLLRKLNFYKDDNFFVFTSVLDNLRAEYDIASNVLNVKQEFKINNNIDKDFLDDSSQKTKKWVINIIENCE